MQSEEIRNRFLRFFEKRGHVVIDGAPLVTSDVKGVTNATLFNTAGMQPLIPYLLGEKHPQGNRLADVQKCLRTVDIDDIGDKTHATFFEMLGNWSLGDYWKKEAINWSYEFLTSKEEGLGLDPNRLYVTVFAGDDNAPRDEEASNIWRDIFVKNNIIDGEGNTDKGEKGRIFFMNADSNWWQAGEDGPCGPDTEMYYDIANKFSGKGISHEQFIEADNNRDVVEVWNDVFMQYKKENGKIIGNLPKLSVDTGAGLERLAMTLQNTDNIYDTDLLKPIMNEIKSLDICHELKSARIIANHLRTAAFLINENVIPSNTDRGYVLRRLIRKAVFVSNKKNLNHDEVKALMRSIAKKYENIYPDLGVNIDKIVHTLNEEIAKFAGAMSLGVKEFEKLAKSGNKITGEEAFKLFSSHGLPIDMTVDLARSNGIVVDTKGYEEEFKKHQDLSRVGAEKKFKGGLADSNDPMIVRYHTATHLLHQALHDVLGDSVMQKGSNITAERLRFDFSFDGKMTDEQKRRVEDIVNEKIKAGLKVNKIILPKAEAEATGAKHFFGEKYGDEVSIYFIGDNMDNAYSKEFCGGPHVDNTSALAGESGIWRFQIKKEEAIAKGIRRIKAVLG